MAPQELVEAGRAIVAISPEVAGTVAVESIFLPQEGVGVLSEVLANFRLILQVSLQNWMRLQELWIVRKRGVFAKLLGDFRMAVQKPVKLPELRTPRIEVQSHIVAVKRILLPQERVRVPT